MEPCPREAPPGSRGCGELQALPRDRSRLFGDTSGCRIPELCLLRFQPPSGTWEEGLCGSR